MIERDRHPCRRLQQPSHRSSRTPACSSSFAARIASASSARDAAPFSTGYSRIRQSAVRARQRSLSKQKGLIGAAFPDDPLDSDAGIDNDTFSVHCALRAAVPRPECDRVPPSERATRQPVRRRTPPHRRSEPAGECRVLPPRRSAHAVPPESLEPRDQRIIDDFEYSYLPLRPPTALLAVIARRPSARQAGRIRLARGPTPLPRCRR